MNVLDLPITIFACGGETLILFTFDCPGAVTVTTVAFVTVFEPLTAVTVIVVVPTPAAVKRPLASIEPAAVLLLVQVMVAAIALPFWSFGAAVNVCVPPTTTLAVDGAIVTVVNTGTGARIVTVAAAVPLTVPLAALIVVVPADNAVNFPLASIVPTAVLLLVQVMVAAIALPFWSFGAAVNVCVPPTNTLAVAGVTVIVVRTGVCAIAFTVVVPLLNPVLAAVAVIVPVLAGFTDIATLPAASDVPLPVAAPVRVTVAPFDGACTFLTLLDSLTAKDTLVDDPAGTEVGFAATVNLNTGYE